MSGWVAWQSRAVPGFDASASVKPWRAVTFYANVRNLLDGRHLVARRPYGARPNAPRWVQIGARVDY
jgi:Fe(3+) dicitrate transport protein